MATSAHQFLLLPPAFLLEEDGWCRPIPTREETQMSSSVGEDEEVVFEVIVSFLRQREKKERRKQNWQEWLVWSLCQPWGSAMVGKPSTFSAAYSIFLEKDECVL